MKKDKTGLERESLKSFKITTINHIQPESFDLVDMLYDMTSEKIRKINMVLWKVWKN